MALLTENKRYVKLCNDGTFEIYRSKEDRDAVKTSTPSETIIKKYEELILDAQSEKYAELRYYNPVEYWTWLRSIEDEAKSYVYAIENNVYDEQETFPIMAEHYPDIVKTIPRLIAKGSTMVSSTNIDSKKELSTAEAYEYVKHYKVWGETVDI
jgi:hypothetical protein